MFATLEKKKYYFFSLSLFFLTLSFSSFALPFMNKQNKPIQQQMKQEKILLVFGLVHGVSLTHFWNGPSEQCLYSEPRHSLPYLIGVDPSYAYQILCPGNSSFLEAGDLPFELLRGDNLLPYGQSCIRS